MKPQVRCAMYLKNQDDVASERNFTDKTHQGDSMMREKELFFNKFLRVCHLRIKSGQVLRDLRIKTGHPLEVLGFKGLDVNKLIFVPKSQFRHGWVEGIDPDRDRLMRINAVDPDRNVIDGNLAIGIGTPPQPEAKKIFGRFERRWQGEFPEQTLFGFQRFLKPNVWDFFRR